MTEPTPGNREERPTIVCLCGSTRFVEAWKQATRQESLRGRIVLSVGVMIHAGDEPIGDGPEKEALDKLHLEKIKMADEVLILDVGGYVGDSTQNEISFAGSIGKKLRWWSEEEGKGAGRLPNS